MPTENYKYLFGFILAIYCLVLTQFGFENFDTGYIPSFSWRIVNGQTVYEDFIYKGPPVTLYFHAFFMKILPETAQFFMFRILAYLFFALQVFLFVSGFDKIYSFKKWNIDKWGLICVCFIISLLNSPPFPWPTTDGLLFASIAFWLMARYKNPGFLVLFAVAFFSVLSALTKQSFYLVPGFFLFWIFISHGYKSAFVFLFQILTLVAIYLSIILSITTLQNFVHQTTSETPLYYLYYTGLHNYIFVPISWAGAIMALSAVSALVYTSTKKQKITAISPVFKWLSIALFVIAIVIGIVHDFRFASRIAFDAVIIGILFVLFERKDFGFLAPIIVALGIAWSTSISLGYQFPIFFATGIIISFILLVGQNLRINPKWYFWIALPTCLVAFAYNYYPYRETNIFTLTYPLETVSPKLKFIKTNKESFEKYSELKQLVGKYGENFIVAPSTAAANYLFNDQSELPADWIIETEVDRQQNRLIKLAADKKNYIFLEKSFLEHEKYVQQNLEEFSSVSYFIYKKFNLVAETQYFLVYNSLKPNERLP